MDLIKKLKALFIRNKPAPLSPSDESSAPSGRTFKQRFLQETISISVIVFLVLVFRSIFFEPFKIPSGSMIPTLMIGDFILVNKLSYGLKVPFSDWFSDPIYITKPQDPQRGDVIVFKFPSDPDVNYIKRVVGTPGDTIEIKNKVVYVNSQPVDYEPVDGKHYMDDMDDKFKGVNLKFYRSHFEKSANFVYQVDEDNYFKSDFEKFVVPDGSFFVMGDNRDFSYDSRFWGVVRHGHIKGRAVLVWFSMVLPFFTDSPFKFRPWRIGTMIH